MKQIAVILLLVLSFGAEAWAAEDDKYTCPMHPHYIADESGTCPICGMDLVPMKGGESKADGDGRTEITISPETIQNIGIRTEKAEFARFGSNIRSYGLVNENVRLLHDVSSRVAGWVEDLEVTAVGDEVKKGQLLFTLYSPELVSAQQDYLSALATGVKGRINSTKKRLESLGVQQKFLDQLKKNRKSRQNIPHYSETDGVISELNVRGGTYVKPGMTIAKIQDYSSVWINVSVAEKDLPFLTKDMPAEVSFPNISKEARTARIDYIYPTVDKASRTGQVRLVLTNPDGTLRPGAYADVTFETKPEKRLAVSREAVLHSSEGDYIIVALGEGRFQPRKVKTGIHNKGKTEIVAGLAESDEVVVSSQFLIDSESALRESFRKMQKLQTPLALLEVKKDQLAMIDHLVDAAIYLQQSLIGEQAFNTSMLMPAIKLNDHLVPQFRGTKLQFILENAEKAIMKAQDALTDTEMQQSLADLMNALKPWLMEGKPDHYKKKNLKLYMDHGNSNLWLQLEDAPANPYGAGHPMLQKWPDKVKAEMPEMKEGEAPMGGPHAGH